MFTDRRNKLYEVIFEADTRSGKAFDLALLFFVVVSILLVMLESVNHIRAVYGVPLKIAEWVVTVLFTLEYFLRIAIVKRPMHYILSMYGIIDLLSVIPTYISLFIPGAHGLIVIRALRMLRLFRILNLPSYVSEGKLIFEALKASRRKIGVFLYAILMIIIIIGTVMYLVEGPEHGFTSIPRSVYWAIVTLTTVGFGDIVPKTALGQLIAGFVMILGYAIIAVPTGIVTSELTYSKPKGITSHVCTECLKEGHDPDAAHCKYCGTHLHPPFSESE